jgi:serine/threonine protein kinase
MTPPSKKYESTKIGINNFIVDSRYKSLELQGSGSYGTVVSAIDSYLCRKVAIKKIIDPFQHIVSIPNIIPKHYYYNYYFLF